MKIRWSWLILVVATVVGCETTSGTRTETRTEASGVERPSEKTADFDEGAESDVASASAAASADEPFVPPAFERPQTCPRTLDVAIPSDKNGDLHAIHDWFCSKFPSNGSPAYAEVEGNSAREKACTYQQTGTTEESLVRCFDEQGQQIGQLMMRNGEAVSAVQASWADGKLVERVRGDEDECWVEVRKGMTELLFHIDKKSGKVEATEKVTYDHEGRVLQRQKRGELPEDYDYETTDLEEVTIVSVGGELRQRTVTTFDDSAQMSKTTVTTFLDGEATAVTTKTYDDKGRLTKRVVKDVDTGAETVSQLTYEGPATDPIEIATVISQDQGAETVIYDFDTANRPISEVARKNRGDTEVESKTTFGYACME